MIEDFSPYLHEKVLVTTDDQELEGRVEAASPVGIVLKLKGRASLLVEARDIESIQVITSVEPIKQKAIATVAAGKYREHLANRHGWRLSDIKNLTEAEAEAIHLDLDHSDLGHRHSTPASVAAVAEAEKV